MADQMVPIALPITFSKVCEVVNQDLNGTNGRHLFGPGGQFAIATGIFDSNYVAAKGSLACFRGYRYGAIVLNTGSIVFIKPSEAPMGADVYMYDHTNNSSVLLFTAPNTSTSDIAHTANKIWMYSGSPSGAIDEYNITLNPFTKTFNRQITGNQSSAGLCAINDTTLITLSGNNVYQANISTNTASNVLKFTIPAGRITTGDFVYTTTNKFLILSHDSIDESAVYLSQYNYSTGTLEVELNIASISRSAFGLYQYNDNLYMGTGDRKIFHINLNSPYTMTLTQMSPIAIYGASQIPSFVNVNLNYTSTDTVAPTTPTNITVTNVGSTDLNLNWNTSTDNVGVSGYYIYINNSTTPAYTISYSASGNIGQYISGLTPSTSYTFTVKAFDAAGNKSTGVTSAMINTNASAGDTTAPTIPNITSLSQSGSAIIVNWTGSTDAVGVAQYELWRKENSNPAVLYDYPTASPYVDDWGTTNAGFTYTYTLRAKDAVGNYSGYSTGKSITTPSSGSGDTVAPSIPTNISISQYGPTEIMITWGASTDSVGVAGYEVYKSTNSTTGYSLVDNVVMPEHYDGNVSPETTYWYKIRAYDASNNFSSFSQPESVYLFS